MKPSSKAYKQSGTFGCLPSLILFLALLGSDFHYGLQTAFFIAFLSLIFGVGGVIGLISAAVMRGKENKDADAREGAD